MEPSISRKTSSQIATQYFKVFATGDLEGIVGLFAPDATVKSSSTNYQPSAPRAFYERVLGMTQEKTVTIHSIVLDERDRSIVTVHFAYDWTLKNGTRKHFPSAIDTFETDLASGKIKSLTITLGADALAEGTAH